MRITQNSWKIIIYLHLLLCPPKADPVINDQSRIHVYKLPHRDANKQGLVPEYRLCNLTSGLGLVRMINASGCFSASAFLNMFLLMIWSSNTVWGVIEINSARKKKLFRLWLMGMAFFWNICPTHSMCVPLPCGLKEYCSRYRIHPGWHLR